MCRKEGLKDILDFLLKKGIGLIFFNELEDISHRKKKISDIITKEFVFLHSGFSKF